jgi:hypothetical protein
MNKLILLIILVFYLKSYSIQSQSCFPQGIWFTTQEQIDNFHTVFSQCTEIEGYVVIDGSNIRNLSGLSNLTSIWGDLRIFDCDSLTNLIGLENLTTIDGNLIIGSIEWGGNKSLKCLAGLDDLTSIGGNLTIFLNDSLIGLMGLNNLISIGGNLRVGYLCNGNPSLQSLAGLENLAFVGGDVAIESNNKLCNIHSLDNLTSIGGNLYIQGNNALTNLTGLDNLSFIGGNVEIRYNNSLQCLAGLGNVNFINQSLKIEWNHALNSLLGITNLTHIEGSLSLINNDALCNLSGFNNLNFVGETITIDYNSSLTSLSGIDNINPELINEFIITNNCSLSSCSISSICDYLDGETIIFEIHNNASGCNSQQEVEEACETVSVKELMLTDAILTHPNPFTTSTTIEYELKQPEMVILTIYDYLGKQVYQRKQNQRQGKQKLLWNDESLTNGVYYLKLQSGAQVVNKKLHKVR